MITSEEPIRVKRLHEHVAERVQALIREGRLRPGDRLPSERELQAMFGIGRPAVREALLMLQHAGLVTLRSGRPAVVASADPRNIVNEMRLAVEHFLADPVGVKELQAARRLLECGIAHQAAKICTEDDLATIRATLERAADLVDDPMAFEKEDMAFHLAIVRISGIRLFEVLFTSITGWLREQRSLALSLPGQPNNTFREHKAVYDAIASRDPVAAMAAMDAHMTQVEITYWAARNAKDNARKMRKERAARERPDGMGEG
jgi:GntR family transcriptional repressor for pyruvate dehydrogenase complex